MQEFKFPIIVDLQNTNFNPFNEIVKEWQVDFTQLGNGKFNASLKQVIYPQIHFASVHFKSQVKQEGISPPGIWSFALVKDPEIRWRNYLVEPHSIIVYSPESEINAVSFPGFDVRIISVSDVELKKHCNEKCLNIIEKVQNHLTLKCNPTQWNSLFNWISGMINEPPIEEPYEAISKITPLLLESEPYSHEVSSSNRLKLIKQVESHIQENITEVVSIKELTQTFNISERTLLYTFKQRFKISTKAFVKALKLNQVHQELYQNNNGNSISSIAKKYGFWHLGQFHTDYKLFFGELPSETTKQ